VRESGSEIASRINRIARSRTRICHRFREDRTHDQNEHESSEDLADQVCTKPTDCRSRAETGEFEPLIGSPLPVWQEVKPDQNGTHERTGDLGNQVWRELGKMASRDRKADKSRIRDLLYCRIRDLLYCRLARFLLTIR